MNFSRFFVAAFILLTLCVSNVSAMQKEIQNFPQKFEDGLLINLQFATLDDETLPSGPVAILMRVQNISRDVQPVFHFQTKCGEIKIKTSAAPWVLKKDGLLYSFVSFNLPKAAYCHVFVNESSKSSISFATEGDDSSDN